MLRPSAEERQAFAKLAEFLCLGSGLRLLRVLEMLVAEAARERAPTERRAEYREKGSGRDAFANIPVQNELAELLSFTPGR